MPSFRASLFFIPHLMRLRLFFIICIGQKADKGPRAVDGYTYRVFYYITELSLVFARGDVNNCK